ncbi:MAG: hypothetical protein IJ001_10060 [Oscillospiraceae bacterium]|nr:hypothetical protein [Oscillospiraceae bacterium]
MTEIKDFYHEAVLDWSLCVTCGQSLFTVEEEQLVLFGPNEPHEFHKQEDSGIFLCMQLSETILPSKKEFLEMPDSLSWICYFKVFSISRNISACFQNEGVL